MVFVCLGEQSDQFPTAVMKCVFSLKSYLTGDKINYNIFYCETKHTSSLSWQDDILMLVEGISRGTITIFTCCAIFSFCTNYGVPL